MKLDYKIKRNASYSWSYIYKNGKSRELWSNSKENLKEKVLSYGFPWDDKKVPKGVPHSEINYNKYKKKYSIDYDDSEDCRCSGWWVKSIYKQYD